MTADRARISQRQANAAPHEVWNAFIGFISSAPREPVTPEQRVAVLAFRYESEVQNGGHLQYFSNRGLAEAAQAVDALHRLGAASHADILRLALAEAASFNQVPQVKGAEYVATALEDPLGQFDEAFSEAKPSLQALLEAYLHAHVDAFIQFDEGEA